MPESRFVSSASLKPLLAYAAAAFVVLLVLAELVPGGYVRSALVAAWLVLFPLGGWLVFRRS